MASELLLTLASELLTALRKEEEQLAFLAFIIKIHDVVTSWRTHSPIIYSSRRKPRRKIWNFMLRHIFLANFWPSLPNVSLFFC